MRGKAGLVIGLAAGYVLGARAGRERYEQIKEQAVKVWNLDPVQKQVAKAQSLGKSALFAVPTAVWSGAVKVTKAATTKGTPGERLDAALEAGEEAKEEVEDAAETSKKAAEDTARKAAAETSKKVEDTAKKAEETVKKSTSGGSGSSESSGNSSGGTSASGSTSSSSGE